MDSSGVILFVLGWEAEVVVGSFEAVRGLDVGGKIWGEVVSELLQTPGLSTPHEFHKL